jgi:predicted TIM-barrel fold metal-dependent hydrolase
MRHGFKILDADRHVMEPMALWPEYLPRKWRDDAPRVTPFAAAEESLDARLERLGDHALLGTPPVVSVRGVPLWRGMTEAAYIEVGLGAESHRKDLLRAETGRGQLESMDESGVDLAMLLPTYAGYLVFNDEIESELSRAYARAYNRWLADLCRTDGDRLLGAALISRHDPGSMIEDMLEGLTLGLRAVVLRPNPILGRTLGHPDYAPFFRACAGEGVPVLLHEGAHTRAETAGASRFETHFAQHACSHPMEAMMGFLALLEGGVLERCPALRVAFLEAGCGFMPYWLWRLDHVEYRNVRNELGTRLRRPPSEYFARQCYVAFEPGEALLAETAQALGPERLVFGSDFPHVDHDLTIVDSLFGEPDRKSALPPDHLRAALWNNPARLLGVPV